MKEKSKEISSYVEYVTKDLRERKAEIENTLEKLEKDYNDRMEEFNSRKDIIELRARLKSEWKGKIISNEDPATIELFNTIEVLKKEKSRLESTWSSDVELKGLAETIDSIDEHNHNMDLLETKLLELFSLRNDFSEIYNSLISLKTYDRNAELRGIIRNIDIVITNYNQGLLKINRMDKEKYIKQFKDREIEIKNIQVDKESKSNFKLAMESIRNFRF